MAVAILLTMAGLPAASTAAEFTDNEFIIGMIPEEQIFQQMKKYRKLQEYLGDKLNIPVKFTVLSRYPHVISRFEERGMDAAFFGAFTAVLAQENLGVRPLVRGVYKNGDMSTRGYLFTRKDTGITSVAGLKNRKAAFVDQVTVTGYLYAIALLKQQGVKDVDHWLGKQYFTGGHDSTKYTELSGIADFGMVKARIFDRMKEEDPAIKDNIRIIATSPDLPDNTLCVRKGLPEPLITELKNILLSMHTDPSGKLVLEELDTIRFTSAEYDDFYPVREIAQKAGVKLKGFQYEH